MHAVERFCDRAMLLERGKLVEIGEPSRIARGYMRINFGRLVHDELVEDGSFARPAPAAQIVNAWCEGVDGERIAAAAHGDPCVACFEVRFNEHLENPVFGITIRNETGATVFATTTALSHLDTGTFEAGETKVVRMRFENWLTASRYNLSPSVASSEAGGETIDAHEEMTTLLVHGWHFTGGVTNLPHGFEVGSR
jgi:hypothetical protein